VKTKKIELKVGQIWAVKPLEKTLQVRAIDAIWSHENELGYCDIAGLDWSIGINAFHSWITRKKAVLIGHYDFEKGKAIAR